MEDKLQHILRRSIQLGDEVVKQADDTTIFKQDCLEIKQKCEKLVGLLRRASCPSSELYEHPARRISTNIEQVLDKALALVSKCKANGIRRAFMSAIHSSVFRRILQQLEDSILDVPLLFFIYAPPEYRRDLKAQEELFPIMANDPSLLVYWTTIAYLYYGSVEERSSALTTLFSIGNNALSATRILQEGAVEPLLKLVKEGEMEDQQNAARLIGILGCGVSLDAIMNAGVCSVFEKILQDGHIKVQTAVAWAISELVAYHPKCQDQFAQHNIITLLVNLIAFETIHGCNEQNMPINKNVMEDDKYALDGIHYPMVNEMQNAVATTTLAMMNPAFPNDDNDARKLNQQHPHHKQSHLHDPLGTKGREHEDPAMRAQMKAMAARALRFLCAGNVAICKNLKEPRTISCLLVLLEKGDEEAKYYSAIALTEIILVPEENAERRSELKPIVVQVSKEVIEYFMRNINEADSQLLIPNIKSIRILAMGVMGYQYDRHYH